MTEHDVNFLELVVALVSMLGRFVASGWIAYAIICSNISTRWQTVLMLLVIIFGLGFGMKYQNPYDINGTTFSPQEQSQTVEQLNGEKNGRYEFARHD